MKVLWFFIIIALSSCASYQADEIVKKRDDLKTPSYKMLSSSISQHEYYLNKPWLQNVKLPKKINDFYRLQDKAIKNDIKSNYLLFLIYISDSECSRRSLIEFNRIPDENCLIALSYLNKTVELDDKFEAGLYKLAYLHQYGIGVDENFNKSVEYYERLVDIKGSYRVLALEHAADIYLFKLNQITKAKQYYEICAQEKGGMCQFKLVSWDQSMEILFHKMRQKDN